jgi:tetratricopeptide (TPR) repeat protein
MSSKALRRAFVFGITLFLGASELQAKPKGGPRLEAWQQSYLDGRAAYDRGDYEGTVRALDSAVSVQPKESLDAFNSSRASEDYLPHLYLGLAFNRLQRPRDALRELKESQRQGAMQNRSYLTKLVSELVREMEGVEKRASSKPPAAPAASGGLAPDASVALREGIRSFFRCRFAEAIRLLEPLRAQVPVARVFFAYAMVGEELLKPKMDADVVMRAKAEYKQAVRDGAPLPDILISPAISEPLTR